MKKVEEIKQRYGRVAGELNERTRRLVAASEALAIGWGGVSAVSRATGLSRQVISQGIKELQEGANAGEGRIRRVGGGRKSNVSKDPGLSEEMERLVEPVTRGDPESALRWTSKSVRKLAKELQHLGHQVSHELVSELLHGLGYRRPREPQDAGGWMAPRPGCAVRAPQCASSRVPSSRGTGGIGGREKERTGGRF